MHVCQHACLNVYTAILQLYYCTIRNMGMYAVCNAHMSSPRLIGCEHALTVLYNECMYGVCVCVCVLTIYLFLVCAIVFASAIIDYNQYSFGECAICITYQKGLVKKCVCMFVHVCVYN